jgi:peptide chain release factor 2
MSEADFWNNQDVANRVVSEVKTLKATIDPLTKVIEALADAKLLWEMAVDANDEASKEEVDAQITGLQAQVDKVETLSLLAGKYDSRNCYLSIYAGEGGTEAQDWAEMLARMYMKFGESMGWDLSEVDRNAGEDAGIKDITLYVKGANAFGYLSTERGTHRLARVSPFNAQGKRQTSFATVEIIPEFDEVTKVNIPENELEVVAFVRASGPGGQNVNKVASAIRIVHKPTNIMVVCSVYRDQGQNKSRAMAILQAKLELLAEEKRAKELDAAKGGELKMGWGTQIRSYVIYDNRVKDTRTGYEMGNPLRVLDGDILGFVIAELQRRAKERGQKAI